MILAGGWGVRLWPMSTTSRPKQLLKLTGDDTLVGDTLKRIAPLVSASEIIVMTSASLRQQMASELSDVPSERVVGEPVGRNTAPAIALAAKILLGRDPDAVMVVLPADHVITDDAAFRDCVALASKAASSERALVTLGVTPTRPETEYGYIRVGEPSRFEGVLEVRSFEEKPDRETAARYMADGGYYWNSGMFIWRADTFLEEVARSLPALAAAVDGVVSVPGDAGFEADIARFYDAVESVSVDYGVMEKAERVLVVPAAFGWDDVGAWPALERIWDQDDDGNTLAGDVIAIDSDGCVAYSESGTLAILGMSDVVVVRTGDATLVCPKNRAGDVRKIVEEYRRRRGKE